MSSLVPASSWIPHYSRAWLSADAVAGVTTAAVVLPQAMAYASLAGLPVEQGLYTALLTLPLYALFGTSRILSVSVTSTIALLTANAVAPLVAPGDAAAYASAVAALAVLVGIVLIAAGLLRLGFLANFISLPTLTGFKVGMGLLIASSQLGKLLGIPFTSGGFLENIFSALSQLNVVNAATLAVTLVTIAVMLALMRWAPRVPAALIAVALGIAVMAFANLEARGVALIAPIPPGLPAFTLPDFSYADQLWAAALGIVLMSAVESVSAARSFARGTDPRIDTSRELIALGAANLGAGFFRGMPGGGGTSQTAVNAGAEAKTQLSSVVTALVVALGLTLLAPLFSLLPQATLGAVVFVAALGLVQLTSFRRIAVVRRRDALLAVAAGLAVLFLGPLEGILVAVILSLLTLLFELNHPQVYVMGRKQGTDDFRDLRHHPHDETFAGLLIVHPVGRLYFANAARVHERVMELVQAAETPVRVLMLDASSISDLEYTVIAGLETFQRELNERGIQLWVAALNPKPLEMLERHAQASHQSAGQMFISVADAVDAYLTSSPQIRESVSAQTA